MKQIRTWKIVLACAMVFNVFALSAGAESAPNAAISVSSQVSVHDVVPSEYFAKYAGKYKSYEEAANAAGFAVSQVSQTRQGVLSDTVANYVKINTVDEYAALLNYYNEFSSAKNTATTSISSEFATMADGDYTIKHEKTWNDNKISWMKAYVIATYNKDKKIIGTPTTDSGLYGFHPGNSWEHKNARSSVNVNSQRTGGSATIVGELSLYIIIDGIGRVATKELECYMSF